MYAYHLAEQQQQQKKPGHQDSNNTVNFIHSFITLVVGTHAPLFFLASEMIAAKGEGVSPSAVGPRTVEPPPTAIKQQYKCADVWWRISIW